MLVKAEGTCRRRIAPPVTPWANPHSQGGTTRSDRRFRCLVAEQTQRLLRDETRPPYSRGPPGDPPRYPPGDVLIFIRKTNPGRLVLYRNQHTQEGHKSPGVRGIHLGDPLGVIYGGFRGPFGGIPWGSLGGIPPGGPRG